MEPFRYNTQTCVYFGRHSMRDNAEQLKELGKKAAIVTTKFVGDAPNLALQDTVAVLEELGTAYVVDRLCSTGQC